MWLWRSSLLKNTICRILEYLVSPLCFPPPPPPLSKGKHDSVFLQQFCFYGYCSFQKGNIRTEIKYSFWIFGLWKIIANDYSVKWQVLPKGHSRQEKIHLERHSFTLSPWVTRCLNNFVEEVGNSCGKIVDFMSFTLGCVAAKMKPLIRLRLGEVKMCKPELLLWGRPIMGCFSLPLFPQNTEGKWVKHFFFF